MLHQVTKDIRVEDGPARVAAIATAGLLDDKITAGHYKVGARDALGKPIVLGKKMTYLDRSGPRRWYVYRMDGKTGRYMPVGHHHTEDAALAAARTLAGGV